MICCSGSQSTPYLFTPARLHVPRIQEVFGMFGANDHQKGNSKLISWLWTQPSMWWKNAVGEWCMQRCVSLLRLTCKCPWYILSAQSVADLSVCGCLDLFRTRGANCRTRSRGHGAEFAELSSPRVLKPTLSPGFLCDETMMRAGPHFNPFATMRLHGMRIRGSS